MVIYVRVQIDHEPTPTPKRARKSRRVADAVEAVMEQTDKTNEQLAILTNELYEIRNVLNNTNSILERIACALENKK